MPGEINTKIEVLDIVEEENYARFSVAPLERGYGTTLGNSLRRVLLSTLPGAAVSSIFIQDVLHEFSTIPGVIEDVSEIILNIKGIAIKSYSEVPVTLTLDVKGPMTVTAGDISEDANIEIINKDHHIATIAEDGEIYMELHVENGKGYLIAEQQVEEVVEEVEEDEEIVVMEDGEELIEVSEESTTVGIIPIDASFTPVEKVNFTVGDYRVGNRIDFDILTMEVWTNGTQSPQEVTAEGAKILIDYLDLFIDLPDYEVEEEVEEEDEEQDLMETYAISIEELDLSLRAFNCLKRAGIETVGDLVQRTESEMKKIKNFGKKSLAEVQGKLDELELDFAEEDED